MSNLATPIPGEKCSLGVPEWKLQDQSLKSTRKSSYKLTKKTNCDWMLITHDLDDKEFCDEAELPRIWRRTSLAGEICDSNRFFSWDACTDH
jgi:hypothetical protein